MDWCRPCGGEGGTGGLMKHEWWMGDWLEASDAKSLSGFRWFT